MADGSAIYRDGMDLDERVGALTAGDLAPMVRGALGDDQCWPLTWTSEAPSWTAFGSCTKGVRRLHGTARLSTGGETVWDAVLKVIGAVDIPRHAHPEESFYWRREALLLGSGLLEQRPGPFVNVRALSVQEPAADEVWLWLECLDDPTAKLRWNDEQHAATAYDLGAFSAQWSAEPPSPGDYPWLARRWLRSWVAFGLSAGTQHAIDVPSFWEHPLVAGALPASVRPRFLSQFGEYDDLLTALEDLPVTLAHHDAQWRNTFQLSGVDARRPGARTVAVDWAFAGLAPVGADLGHLIACNLEHWAVQPGEAARHDESTTAAYLQGLADFGWRGDERAVRFARAVSASLQIVPALAAQVSWLHSEPAPMGAAEYSAWPQELATKHHISVEAVMEGWAAIFGYLLDVGDEARRLAAVLRV